jgi:hypothetical protein
MLIGEGGGGISAIIKGIVYSSSVIAPNFFTASGHNHPCYDDVKARPCKHEDAPCMALKCTSNSAWCSDL